MFRARFCVLLVGLTEGIVCPMTIPYFGKQESSKWVTDKEGKFYLEASLLHSLVPCPFDKGPGTDCLRTRA